MRISSLTYFTSSLGAMQTNQANIARLSEQIASDTRILSPKDDPLATGKALDLSNRVALRDQHLANQQKAELDLNYESTVLNGMRGVLNNVNKQLTGMSPNQTQALRDQYAAIVNGAYIQLKELANTRNPEGNYIFGGYQSGVVPFTHSPAYGTATTVSPDTTYNGTAYGSATAPAGVRSIEVASGRDIQVNDNLDVMFQSGAAPGKDDILRTVDQLAVDLKAGTITQAQLDTTITKVNTALTALGRMESRVGAAQVELKEVGTATRSLRLAEQSALSGLLQLDKAAAIIEQQSRQTSLEAAQRAYAQTSKLSLFSYL